MALEIKDMDEKVARFMLRAAKFEFFLVNFNIGFAHLSDHDMFHTVAGLNWSALAEHVEQKCPFAAFDFETAGFAAFKHTAPMYLTWHSDAGLKWDSRMEVIDSWDKLFNRSYAQLRNNIAHGNKMQLPSAFAENRTAMFLSAGNALVDFIAAEVLGVSYWDAPLYFQ